MSKEINFIVLALTSSLFAAALTSGVNWLLQRNNYRNDFYKIILSKRLEAFEVVERLISELRTVAFKGDIVTHMIFAKGYPSFQEFIDRIINASHKSIWLNDEVGKKTAQLNALLLKFIPPSTNADANSDALFQFGLKCKTK